MKCLPVFYLVVSSTGLFSQQLPLLEYAAVTSFNWSMFKGDINLQHLNEMGDNTQAVTVSSLSYAADAITDRSATLKVVAQFNPNESWTRYPKLDRPDEALNHEKRHFDITEIYARKIRQLLTNTRFSSGRFNEELDAIFKRLVSEHRAEQSKYDHETEHSMNTVEQQKWDNLIEAQLKLLSNYADTTITVEFN